MTAKENLIETVAALPDDIESAVLIVTQADGKLPVAVIQATQVQTVKMIGRALVAVAEPAAVSKG